MSNKKSSHTQSRYSKRYYKLRAQKRKLRSEFRKAKRENASKTVLSKLNNAKRSISRTLKRLRKKEQHDASAKQFSKYQKAFNTNPHTYAKKTFNPQQKTGSPQFDKTTCEDFFKHTYSDK